MMTTTVSTPPKRSPLAEVLQLDRPLSTESDRVIGSAASAILFGPFRLLATQRLLLKGDRPVRLGSRALDVLIVLVERPGELVSKEEIMARVWPNTFVESANLKVHVAALRRALGDGHGGNRYLVNIPGRGYCFVAPVEVSENSKSSALDATPTEPMHNLRASVTRLIGRADVVSTLAARLSGERFLTIVGSGGIGKTSVALAVAERLTANYTHGIWFIDLAPLGDPLLVPTTVASALRVECRSENPLSALMAVLRNKQMLLVLDNCEHVIEAAAAMAADLLKGAPGVHVLATSREPLRAAGERVHRLSPLESPPASAGITAAEALSFPAVQLFVERAAASLDGFALSDADAPDVAAICRALDGIALAIELAAALVDTFGVQGLAARLDDRFWLLTRGRRTALPRHRTMSATLDWSYALLPKAERVVLRRLAVFTGAFTAEAASVVAGGEIAAPDVVDCVANLVTKSLVTAHLFGSTMRYRLPETTRAYALEKLMERGEFEQISRRHAECYRDVFEQIEATCGTAHEGDVT